MGDVVRDAQTAKAARADALDVQHEELGALVARILERDARSALKAELSLLLRQLLLHTAHHFADEEEYMRDTGYARLDTHQIMHRQLLETLRTRVTEFEAGSGRLGTRLITFLNFWLMTHINGMDKDITRRASPVPASSLRPVRKH
jgi:hemerythrin